MRAGDRVKTLTRYVGWRAQKFGTVIELIAPGVLAGRGYTNLWRVAIDDAGLWSFYEFELEII